MIPPRPVQPDGTVYGRQAVATSHPLAVEAGAQMLREGGSAVDAAVAMAAALTVVEPTSNGLGSDAFALVWDGSELHGLNGSGASPAALTREQVGLAGETTFPVRGWLPVTVPGAPAAWHELHDRFGKLRFERVLEPAIRMAEDGHPVAPLVSQSWQRAARVLGTLTGAAFAGWRETFMPDGRAPEPGDVWRAPGHAETLRRLAASGCRDLYTGELARRIHTFSRETGGLLRAEDLAPHHGEWVTPLSVSYRDTQLWELPPNGQGIVALQALGLLERLDPPESWDDARATHEAVEAIKLAFADAEAHVADPRTMREEPQAFLEASYLNLRRAAIKSRAELRQTGLPQTGGTVFLVAADAGGMMVSFIQSNYMGFGSGVVVPGTGIALQNRGAGFSLEAGHPNQVGPSKRPFHTIIPGFLTRAGKPWGPFGVMGGHMQPQGHVQVARALVDLKSSPQSALDLPRWQWERDLILHLETGWPEALHDDLVARGHEVRLAPDPGLFGRGQIILRGADGILAAGSEGRADGRATAW